MTDTKIHPDLAPSSGSEEVEPVTESDEGTHFHIVPSEESKEWTVETAIIPVAREAYPLEVSAGPPLISSLPTLEPREDLDKETEEQASHPRRTYRPVVTIEGEDFLLSREEGYIFLSHPEWSVTGVGETRLEAELDLKRRVQRMFGDFLTSPASEMTLRALDLRDFLFRVYGTK